MLLKPALEYVLSASSHPLLLLSSAPVEPLLSQLVAALRSLLGWPLSSIADEWSRFAPAVGVQALSEAEGWLAEDELWMPDDDKEDWWREEEARRRRVRDSRRGKPADALTMQQQSGAERTGEEGLRGVTDEDVEDTLERLFGAAFRDQRLVSGNVVFDAHLSIVEDDDD